MGERSALSPHRARGASPLAAPADSCDLLHEPADRGARQHDRQRRSAVDRGELHTTVSGLQWTVDAYTLVLASLLMLSGSMADRLGRRRVFETGLVLFTLGSLLCSVAPSLGWLIAFRMMQAVGGSMLNPVAMSIIRNVFTDPRERAQAIGMWGATVGISLALGPVVGGALVQSVGWRSIFWINVPVGLLALALTIRFVPESRAPRAAPPRSRGSAARDPRCSPRSPTRSSRRPRGLGSRPQTLGLFALVAVALSGLLAYERRRFEPLLEMRFFRSVPVLERERDRGARLLGARSVPLPEHALPAGGPRPLRARRRATRCRSPR